MEKSILRNEKGVALIIALIMLLILTFIGISSISTTTFETSLSGNERVGTGAFYAAEGGAQAGFNQIVRISFPDNMTPVARTQIGEDSYYWSGTPKDKSNPVSLQSLGDYGILETETGWVYKRYRLNFTGESLAAVREVEVQMLGSPHRAATTEPYNN